MSPKSFLIAFRKELELERESSNLYKKLYKELMNEKKTLDNKDSLDYEYKYLRAVLAVDENLITKEIKDKLVGKAFDDKLIIEFVPSNDKTIIVLKYIEARKKIKKIC